MGAVVCCSENEAEVAGTRYKILLCNSCRMVLGISRGESFGCSAAEVNVDGVVVEKKVPMLVGVRGGGLFVTDEAGLLLLVKALKSTAYCGTWSYCGCRWSHRYDRR